MPLDFANETWVRLYKRDTVTLKLLSWQARAVLWELLRKCDRSGVIDTDGHGVAGIAALIGIPLDVVAVGIGELVASETLAITTGGYVIPRFVEAQETPQSGSARNRVWREKRRDDKLMDSMHGVSPNVSPRLLASSTSDETSPHDDETFRNDDVARLKEKKRKEKKEREPNALRAVSLSLWEIQNKLRQTAIPGSRALEPADKLLKAVDECVSQLGFETCKLALLGYAHESKRNAETAKYFNGVSNWRLKNCSAAASRAEALGIAVEKPAPQKPSRPEHFAWMTAEQYEIYQSNVRSYGQSDADQWAANWRLEAQGESQGAA